LKCYKIFKIISYIKHKCVSVHSIASTIGLDCAVFYVSSNTVQVIWETVFTGQKTQVPTVSKY